MKPVRLELAAFGPYEAQQIIDFAALGGAELFLVHGPTGAGKTSLFDGITYALFGKLAGTRGTDRIRSDRAAAELRTKVVFTFKLGAVTYRVERCAEWERPYVHGGGTTTEDATSTLYVEGKGEPIAKRRCEMRVPERPPAASAAPLPRSDGRSRSRPRSGAPAGDGE